MNLRSGAKLGPYEIQDPIGAGGMGEVYRANDTRLDRTVAIKVLPSGSASNPDLRQRFEREAKAVSSLNHPHICILYDVGQQDGIDYLVMEYLEGETLSQRLKKGPLPIDELLRHAVQVADALDKAHRQGLVHRDLKPGNVMLTKSGAKLLDFGLAKLQDSGGPVQGAAGVTRTTPLTGEGAILGTLQYMSPEQLEGGDADSRSDIFAFGCVLYEMATGRRAFEGKSQASLIAAIMEREPPPPMSASTLISPSLDHLIRKCLAKSPDERWQTALDLRDELKWIGVSTGLTGPAQQTSARKWRSSMLIGFSILSTLLAIIAWALLISRPAPPRQTIRFSIEPDSTESQMYWPRISPDGTMIAYTASDKQSDENLIFIRPLSRSEPYKLTGTEGANRFFWSPDSKFLAFFVAEGTRLKKVAATGGPPQLICETARGGDGTWGKDGDILFDEGPDSVIHRVSSFGGAVTAATYIDTTAREAQHGWPCFLPDGRHFLYLTVMRGLNSAEGRKPMLKIGSLDGKESKSLFLTDSHMEYDPAGFLLYTLDSTLMARRFDAASLEVSGDPFPLMENLGGGDAAQFSVSNTGTLVHFTKSSFQRWSQRELCWLDRKGQWLGTVGDTAAYRGVRLSHDEQRIAYVIEDPKSQTGDIWLRDLARNVSSRLTFDTTYEACPLWSVDDRRIVFARISEGGTDWISISTDGLGVEERVAHLPVEDSLMFLPQSVSSDGELFTCLSYDLRSEKRQVYLFHPRSDSVPRPLLPGQFSTTSPALSPDDRFLAFTSSQMGEFQLYVMALGKEGGKWQISDQKGGAPLWSKNGKELFFTHRGAGNLEVWSVPVQLTPTFKAGVASKQFEADIYTNDFVYSLWRYDITSDGKRFIVDRALPDRGGIHPRFQVVLNWSAQFEGK